MYEEAVNPESAKDFVRYPPKGTPVEIIRKLNAEINAGLSDPDVRSRYASLGSVPNPGSPADFGKLVAAETEKWATVIKFAGIKPE